MAAEAEMKKMALKAIEDDDFRAALKADRVKAAASMGITFTPEQLNEMEKVNKVLEEAGMRESKMLGYFWI